MSRFPLFPLLLSFSTTLQSACLQDKCSVQPFKDNDAECMPDMTISPDLSVLPDGNNNPDMTKLASFGTTLSYQFTLTGSKKRVDSVGMIDINKNETDGNIEIGQVGALIADRVNHKIRVIVQTIKINNGVPVSSSPSMNVPEADSTIPVTDQIDSASFSRAGVTYFTKKNASGPGVDKAVMQFVPWFPFDRQIAIVEKDIAQYYSLSSDVDNRIHAVIADVDSKASLLAPGNFLFNGDNLIENSHDSADRRRVFVGNLDINREPELITWDVKGLNGVIFKYIGTKYQKIESPAANLPEIQCSPRICPVALGDLNQDGLSDLIVSNGANLNIYYGTGNIAAPFLMPAQKILEGQDVQAIAVSIPSGDDPPKLVWATSSFKPSSMGSTTGTNTITINVLPIK